MALPPGRGALASNAPVSKGGVELDVQHADSTSDGGRWAVQVKIPVFFNLPHSDAVAPPYGAALDVYYQFPQAGPSVSGIGNELGPLLALYYVHTRFFGANFVTFTGRLIGASVSTSNPATRDRVKTGHQWSVRDWWISSS